MWHPPERVEGSFTAPQSSGNTQVSTTGFVALGEGLTRRCVRKKLRKNNGISMQWIAPQNSAGLSYLSSCSTIADRVLQDGGVEAQSYGRLGTTNILRGKRSESYIANILPGPILFTKHLVVTYACNTHVYSVLLKSEGPNSEQAEERCFYTNRSYSKTKLSSRKQSKLKAVKRLEDRQIFWKMNRRNLFLTKWLSTLRILNLVKNGKL